MIKFQKIFIVFAVVLTACTTEKVPLQVADIFTENMVLQQQTAVPVWGKTTPGEKVRVSFAGKEEEAIADDNGKWILKIGPYEAREQGEMIVASSTEEIKLTEVIVGDVWICSGQSNMEMNVGCTWAKVKDSEQEIATAHYPEIRFFTVGRNIPINPVDTIQTTGWQVCTPETVPDFSAVGYFFGRDIHMAQDIPVGLIQTVWGGTDAESWTSEEGLAELGYYNAQLKKLNELRTRGESVEAMYQEDHEKWLAETAEADEGIQGNDTIFARVDYDDSDWLVMEQPQMWESTEVGAFDGVMWFRTTVTIPKEQVGKDLMLSLAPPDDADETWFNGVKIGESKEWDVVRHYKIPVEAVKEGENLIAVRLSDPQGNGGFMGEDNDFSIYSYDGWKTLYAGEMKYHKGFDKYEINTQVVVPEDPNFPTLLFNGMINPLIPFAMKGVIWYQGENNTGKAVEYRTLFPGMITDWRNHWGQGDFPFLFVQLANFMEANDQPTDHPWAQLREAQTMALDLKNTGMAVTIDIGDPKDIHPANKQEVGKRLSLVARAKVYGENIPFSGPTYKSMEKMENKVVLRFDHVYEGLFTSDNKEPKGFAIAGNDKKFYWADAEIVGETIVLTCPEVPEPVAVRYAWGSNPPCNLMNNVGLAASPFRTGTW